MALPSLGANFGKKFRACALKTTTAEDRIVGALEEHDSADRGSSFFFFKEGSKLKKNPVLSL